MTGKKNNPFGMYDLETKTAVIKAFNGAEIQYRELTMEENDTFQKVMIKGFDKDGQPELDVDKYAEVKYLKVATGLIEPKMSVEELKALPKSAAAAIGEILDLIAGKDDDDEDVKESEKGN